MKKISLLLAVAAMSFVAQAGTSSTPSVPSESTGKVSFDVYPRVKIYGDTRNAISYSTGEILVCPLNMVAEYDSKCFDRTTNYGNGAGKNAWVRVQDDAPPGFRVTAYEYRLTGTSGAYRSLIVYYSKVQ